jgi:hypothetical protein
MLIVPCSLCCCAGCVQTCCWVWRLCRCQRCFRSADCHPPCCHSLTTPNAYCYACCRLRADLLLGVATVSLSALLQECWFFPIPICHSPTALHAVATRCILPPASCVQTCCWVLQVRHSSAASKVLAPDPPAILSLADCTPCYPLSCQLQAACRPAAGCGDCVAVSAAAGVLIATHPSVTC